MRILHGDLHQWNVRNAHGMLSPIDFEDLMMVGRPGYCHYAVLLSSKDISCLRKAFQEVTPPHPLPERHPGEIDSFIALAAWVGEFYPQRP